jgi:hypothetical protein
VLLGPSGVVAFGGIDAAVLKPDGGKVSRDCHPFHWASTLVSEVNFPVISIQLKRLLLCRLVWLQEGLLLPQIALRP